MAGEWDWNDAADQALVAKKQAAEATDEDPSTRAFKAALLGAAKRPVATKPASATPLDSLMGAPVSVEGLTAQGQTPSLMGSPTTVEGLTAQGRPPMEWGTPVQKPTEPDKALGPLEQYYKGLSQQYEDNAPAPSPLSTARHFMVLRGTKPSYEMSLDSAAQAMRDMPGWREEEGRKALNRQAAGQVFGVTPALLQRQTEMQKYELAKSPEAMRDHLMLQLIPKLMEISQAKGRMPTPTEMAGLMKLAQANVPQVGKGKPKETPLEEPTGLDKVRTADEEMAALIEKNKFADDPRGLFREFMARWPKAKIEANQPALRKTFEATYGAEKAREAGSRSPLLSGFDWSGRKHYPPVINTAEVRRYRRMLGIPEDAPVLPGDK